MNYERLFLFLFVVLVRVRCDYELQVRLDHYMNPDHLQARGESCCDEGQDELMACSCSNRFTICIQPSGADFDIISFIEKEKYDCPDAWKSFVTGIVGEEEIDADNMSFKEKSLIDPLNDVSNPIVVSAQGAWSGSFKLVLAVKNRVDMFKESLVDFMPLEWKIDGDTQDFETKEIQGVMRRSSFLISVRVVCTDNTQGSQCNETKVYLEEESYEEELAVQGNDKSKESSPLNIDSGHEVLVISLSVIGGIFGVLIFVSFASFISYITCCQRKGRKETDEKSSPGEKEPFLSNDTGSDSDHPRYHSSPFHGTDTDGDPSGASHSYQTIDGESGSGVYTEVHTNRVQQRVISQIAESARRASLQPPGTGTYSIIRRGDLVVNTPGVVDDDEGEEPVGRASGSGYSMITRESMSGYVSEELSDVTEVDEEGGEEHVEIADDEVVSARQEGDEEEEDEDEEESGENGALLKHIPDDAKTEDNQTEEEKARPRMATPPSD